MILFASISVVKHEELEKVISEVSRGITMLLVLPMEVKKSLWAESDCRQLSNNKHQHGSSILKKKRIGYQKYDHQG